MTKFTTNKKKKKEKKNKRLGISNNGSEWVLKIAEAILVRFWRQMKHLIVYE